MRLVNVYHQLRQQEGVSSQGSPAQETRWKEIIGLEKIILGGDLNAHSDRWDPPCQPKRGSTFWKNHMDEYDLVDVIDGEPTHMTNRKGETWESRIDLFRTKASMAARLETATDSVSTSDHAIECAQLGLKEWEGAKVSIKMTG